LDSDFQEKKKTNLIKTKSVKNWMAVYKFFLWMVQRKVFGFQFV